ncbi:MAG: VOC family protein [Alphaproteobacteria bacterium]|nr:VOC family protein [Alphaproteobacteria bacterium]
MITGINHINITVQDIDISFKFYMEVMEFKPLCKSEGSAYFLVGSLNLPACVWFSLDLDREKNVSQHRVIHILLFLYLKKISMKCQRAF